MIRANSLRSLALDHFHYHQLYLNLSPYLLRRQGQRQSRVRDRSLRSLSDRGEGELPTRPSASSLDIRAGSSLSCLAVQARGSLPVSSRKFLPAPTAFHPTGSNAMDRSSYCHPFSLALVAPKDLDAVPVNVAGSGMGS